MKLLVGQGSCGGNKVFIHPTTMLMQALNDGDGIHGSPTLCVLSRKLVTLLNDANRQS
jgi:hypothetical protein